MTYRRSGRSTHYAAVLALTVAVELLLAAGCSKHVELDARLLEAAERGDAAAAERLLAEGAGVDATNYPGRTPLR